MEHLTQPTDGAESLAELPELPKPKHIDDIGYGGSLAFTADQMRSYALSAIQRERDFCMQILEVLTECDNPYYGNTRMGGEWDAKRSAVRERVAAAIRQSGK